MSRTPPQHLRRRTRIASVDLGHAGAALLFTTFQLSPRSFTAATQQVLDLISPMKRPVSSSTLPPKLIYFDLRSTPLVGNSTSSDLSEVHPLVIFGFILVPLLLILYRKTSLWPAPCVPHASNWKSLLLWYHQKWRVVPDSDFAIVTLSPASQKLRKQLQCSEKHSLVKTLSSVQQQACHSWYHTV